MQKTTTRESYFTSNDPHRVVSRHLFDIFFYIYSGILSDMSFDVLSDILSDIFSAILSGISSDVPSGVLSGISSDLLSGNLSEISSDVLSVSLSDILPGIFSDNLSDILSAFLSGCTTYLRLRSGAERWHSKLPGGGGGGGGPAADIKSNNLHLAGGELLASSTRSLNISHATTLWHFLVCTSRNFDSAVPPCQVCGPMVMQKVCLPDPAVLVAVRFVAWPLV